MENNIYIAHIGYSHDPNIVKLYSFDWKSHNNQLHIILCQCSYLQRCKWKQVQTLCLFLKNVKEAVAVIIQYNLVHY